MQLVYKGIIHSLKFKAAESKVEMGGCGGRLMGLAFLLCMLSRVSCNSKASNGVLGQHQKDFVEKYREEIQTYIMTGGEIGWQHCDLLTANDYQE